MCEACTTCVAGMLRWDIHHRTWAQQAPKSFELFETSLMDVKSLRAVVRLRGPTGHDVHKVLGNAIAVTAPILRE